MELTIEHIQHYLAYGLKVQHTSIDEDVTDICDVESISIDCVTFNNGCDYYLFWRYGGGQPYYQAFTSSPLCLVRGDRR